MERASRLIGKLKFPGDTVNAADIACAAWPVAVGKKIAAHARAVRMVRSSLIVEVDDDIWQKQLFTLRRQILAKLETSIGPGIVQEVEFRIGPMRRGPRRAEHITPVDEADRISDPVMRKIYKAARNKALA